MPLFRSEDVLISLTLLLNFFMIRFTAQDAAAEQNDQIDPNGTKKPYFMGRRPLDSSTL
jgi:hypothetical protein